MNVTSWDHIPVEILSTRASRQVLHTGMMTIARLVLAKGAIVGMHSHLNEQVTTMVSGKLRFDFSGTLVDVSAGEILPIPPHVPHSVEALEDSIAVDLFSPQREDWIRGDDAYLRR